MSRCQDATMPSPHVFAATTRHLEKLHFPLVGETETDPKTGVNAPELAEQFIICVGTRVPLVSVRVNVILQYTCRACNDERACRSKSMHVLSSLFMLRTATVPVRPKKMEEAESFVTYEQSSSFE